MVSSSSWKPLEILPDGFPRFNEKAVLNLQKIISETGASIALTTSHKFRFSIPEWETIFNNRGIFVKIDRLKNNTNNWIRKDEIVHWFNTNAGLEDFVILDDDKSLNDLPL